MPTLHSNNPVPSNGLQIDVVRGSYTLSMTLSGVGVVRAVVQLMAHEDGAAPGQIGSQIVVSGTTTVTATSTFNAEAGKVYLQLIDISPACKFSATATLASFDAPPISAPLATILATVPAAGTTARATDVFGSSIESDGTKWVGSLGTTFATFAALDAVSKTNIGQGATATLLDGTEYSYSGTAWVATNLTPLPSGGYQALVASPSVQSILVRDLTEGRDVNVSPRSMSDIASGATLMSGIWGSSSDRRCATADSNLLTETSNSTGAAEYTDGWWRYMQSAFNSQFSLAWNGAVAGNLWAATAAKIASDLALSTMPHINIAFLRPGANDIATGATVDSIKASIQSTIEGQFLARGIRVVLITSHTRNPLDNASYLAQYDAMAAFLDSMVLAYPGLVMHANTYAQFGVGIQTPLTYMMDGQHLNELGVSVAVKAFEDVVRVWGRPARSMDPWDYGEVIMEIDPNNLTGLAYTGGSQSAGTVDSGKRKRILFTGTSNGGRIVQANYVTGKTLAAGDLCRLWADVEPVNVGSSSTIYGAGVVLRNGAGVVDSKRYGSYVSGADFTGLAGNRIRGLSRIFTIPTSLLTVPQLCATHGAGTNSALVGRCALIRVKKAVA